MGKNNLPPGDVAFYDNYIPSLEADKYTIYVESGIQSLDTGNYFSRPVTQVFEVRSPQFSLPATDIHTVYPPNSSNAIYEEVLPHIVLNERALPWERYLQESDDTIPWLALLVFREGEIPVDPTTNSSLITSTVSDFLQPVADVIKPAINPKSVAADVLSSNCQSIRVSADSFKALTPYLNDLKYLTHVRQVNPADQVILSADDLGWFSVVVGNRLLLANGGGTRYYVHLVSLEGLTTYLTPGANIPKKAGDPSQEQDFQLISLYNWSFVSQSQKGQSFADLVENFVNQADGNPAKLLLRRYVTAPANPDAPTQAALTRLSEGYVPLTYQAPTGEQTFAWYRGPLAPIEAQALPRPAADFHYPSADAAMIYDQTNGVFDQTYAAAWSIGRALALADGAFSQALMDYRKKSYQIVGKLMDVLTVDGLNSAADLKAILDAGVVRDAFDQLIKRDVGSHLTKAFQQIKSPAGGPTPPSPTAASPVDVAQQFLAGEPVQDLLKSEVREDIDPIAAWLAHKRLLYDLPFQHLVPDQLMLPAESLRFFYIDSNWLDCLVDGALSLGVQGSKDAFLNQAMRGVIDDAVAAHVGKLRQRLLGLFDDPTTSEEPKSGILIRSALISGWPNLVVQAFLQQAPVKTVRLDHLSDTVLLALFADVPDTITLSEPQQGLRFGVEDGSQIILRKLTPPNVGKPIAGKEFPTSGGFQQFYRPPVNGMGGGVLNVNEDNQAIVPLLQSATYLGQTIGPADFAIQMVKAPEQISFNPKA